METQTSTVVWDGAWGGQRRVLNCTKKRLRARVIGTCCCCRLFERRLGKRWGQELKTRQRQRHRPTGCVCTCVYEMHILPTRCVLFGRSSRMRDIGGSGFTAAGYVRREKPTILTLSMGAAAGSQAMSQASVSHRHSERGIAYIFVRHAQAVA